MRLETNNCHSQEKSEDARLKLQTIGRISELQFNQECFYQSINGETAVNQSTLGKEVAALFWAQIWDKPKKIQPERSLAKGG